MKVGEDKSIRVLIVEDSRVVSEFISRVLNSDPMIEVVGIAADGREAVEAARRTRPHVITMDIHMPGVDGFQATRNIMETVPTPIIIVSASSAPDNVAIQFQAIEAGALTVAALPHGPGHPEHEDSAKQLIDAVKLMSEVKVVRRWVRPKPPSTATASGPLKQVKPTHWPIRVVAIGASTGGPLALQVLLAALPKDLSVPVLVVQHMTPGFTHGFVEWLAKSTGFPVRLAVNGESLLPGHAYVAPDDFQMGVNSEHHIILTRHERENGMRPSVSFLFRSVEAAFGAQAAGVLLTGMGVDGVEELWQLRKVGAITLAQDEESSIIHGMPGQAIKAGAAMHILSPEGIAKALTTIVSAP